MPPTPPVRLSVNLNKAALVRNSRDLDLPSLTALGRIALAAGAGGLTLHPRPDERHARYQDVEALAEVVGETDAELNVEGNPFHPPWMAAVRNVRPHQVTLVPDAPGARTSEQGWDLRSVEPVPGVRLEELARMVGELRALGSRVSLFVEPDPEVVEAAARLGAHRVELRTEPYARAFSEGRGGDAVVAYRQAALAAVERGLGLNAGHDLNLENLPGVLALPGLLEVSIGHALVAEALVGGLGPTVRRYVELLRRNAASGRDGEAGP